MNPLFRTPITAAALALCLTGCLFEDEKSPEGKVDSSIDNPRTFDGAPLDSIMVARTAVLADGILYVANADPAARGIVAVDAETDTIISFHPTTLPPVDLALAGGSKLVIAESDYVNGSLSLLDLESGRLASNYRSVASDIALSAHGDSTFLQERSLGVVTGFLAGRLEGSNVFLDVQTGEKSNPYRTALGWGKAFITRYGKPSLLIVDPSRVDGGARDSFDLSGYAADSLKGSPGAVPHMDGAVVYEDNLFVTVQRLTGFKAKDTSKVIVIGATPLKVKKEIPLRFRNPIAAVPLGRYLYVTCVDEYGTHKGGVERIDMLKLEAAGTVVTEEELAADVATFVPVSGTKGYVMYFPDFKVTRIKAVAINP